MGIQTAIHAMKRAVAAKPVEPGFIMRDSPAFFAGAKAVTGKMTQTQVDTINALLQACKHWPRRWLAYALATAWHEARLEPIREWGRGKGRRYGVAGARMKPDAILPTYAPNVPYGRGLVQLTWVENYEWLDKIAAEAGLIKPGELLADFDLALRPDMAVLAMSRGMETGAFTGKKLADYLGADYRQARRIINGMDKADLIAGYALQFERALIAGKWDK